MSPASGFLSFLLLTLILLGCVVFTGLRARRRAHLTFVASSVASLAATIYFAEKLGELYDLESAGVIVPVHLFLAKVTTVAYLLPIVSGVRTIRNPAGKGLHRRLAFLVLGLTVLTSVTGAWMVLAAEPLA